MSTLLAEPVIAAPVEAITLRSMSDSDLADLNRHRKYSLSVFDLAVIRKYFKELQRDPTDVELEVLAQTWSEHCKHRVFNARILHRENDRVSVIRSLFQSYIKDTTEAIIADKPDFVLGAFNDNAGFIRIDDRQAVCFKVETHNHPSALEPYAGANTGLGGVIRDILGAGRGAKPIAATDVFCFGDPALDINTLPVGVLHPLSVFRGVVRGVRDYGNRMGIPTVSGAIHFHRMFTCNPLVFCGTLGTISVDSIAKPVKAGLALMVLGGRTGRDGLKGATFSSASLAVASRSEDMGSVQIGNPIEEKKILDVIVAAGSRNLIESITDCGAGGLSSSVGEMAGETGARIYLEQVPLKAETMTAWEIFLSESQERMVLAVKNENVGELVELARTFDVECVEIGVLTNSGHLEVYHNGTKVCDLETDFLHQAPHRILVSHYIKPVTGADTPDLSGTDPGARPGRDGARYYRVDDLCRRVIGHLNVATREPVIREYDFEVQGNTVLKPLGGPVRDNVADGVAMRIENSDKYVAIGCGLAPHYSIHDPEAMARAVVDEAVRQLVTVGANPEKIALLDNFCMGNPDDQRELGKLVAACRAMAAVARAYKTPFISGKDSFYNYYLTDRGEKASIPITLLISSVGIVEAKEHIIPAYVRKSDSLLCLLGVTGAELGGSILSQTLGYEQYIPYPGLNAAAALAGYLRFHQAVKQGLVLSAHDLSDGGLAVAAAEMAFGLTAGLEIDLSTVPATPPLTDAVVMFSESNSRILFEIDAVNLEPVTRCFEGLDFAVIGRTNPLHRNLVINKNQNTVATIPLTELKEIWKNGLARYY